jgi:membrane-associated protease RseP (regulator of RpoE activity)
MSDETPSGDDTPTVSSTPVEASTAASPPPAAPRDEDDVPSAASPAAPVPAAEPAPPAPRSGLFVPKWLAVAVAVVVAALVFGAVGYAIGDSGHESSGSNASARFPDGGRVFPGGPLGNPGNGNSGNGNSENGNSENGNSGNGSGQTTTGTGFLGVQIADADNGAQVTNVQSGSPAANGGLQSGDVITAVNGTSITSAADLAQAVHSHNRGDQVTVTYTRGGKSATATVTLGSAQTSQNS